MDHRPWSMDFYTLHIFLNFLHISFNFYRD
jgi:hypothetical protein